MKLFQAIFLATLLVAVFIRVLLSLLFSPQLQSGQFVSFQTTLLNEPTNHGRFETISVFYSNGFGSVPLFLAFPVGNNLHYGQVVTISGKTKIKVLGNGRVITTISSSHFKIEPESSIGLRGLLSKPLLNASYYLRLHIQTFYEKVFSQRLAALLLGIVLGVRGNFPKDFLQDLQADGVMHVIAASGMNVTMVSGFLLGIFTLFCKRQWAIALTSGGLLFYCVLSGLQASILRATIMILFSLCAQLLGRQYSGLYGLLLAGCGMLLYNPTWITDIGFELSFVATLGIFLIKPLLPKWKIFSDDIGTTIAAQIATLPILVGSFGSYGLLSVLVNALVLWTVPPLMILGGIGGFVGLVFEPLGSFLLALCLPFLWFFEKVIILFGGLRWQLSLTELPVLVVVGYYMMLGSWIWMKRVGVSKEL